MLDYLTLDLIPHLIEFQAVILLVILSNMWISHRARRHTHPDQFPFVSILIPARNEEQNIARCVHSLLAQDYPRFEVLVLDDHSSDNTPAILTKIRTTDPRVRMLTGQALPDGWLGKSWACAQLAEHAQGELLLFTDADTYHRPLALTTLVTVLQGEQADLLTGFPGQELRSWGERLTVPFFSWAMYSFSPILLAYLLKLPFLSGGVGQMLLFRRTAYQSFGGHAAVYDQIAEDLSLVRKTISASLRWRVVHISDLLTCRMYNGGRQAFQGFSKNYFAAFGFRVLPYLFVFGWLAVMFLMPLTVMALFLLGFAPQAQPMILAACIGLSLLLWMIPYRFLGFGICLALIYPFTLLVNEIVAINSLWLSVTGQLSWKGRELGRARWKWL